MIASPAGAQTAPALVSMVAAHIREHLTFAMPEGPVQNFPVEYAFVLKPDGDIDELRLVRPIRTAGIRRGRHGSHRQIPALSGGF